jgi:hypothetical protein
MMTEIPAELAAALETIANHALREGGLLHQWEFGLDNGTKGVVLLGLGPAYDMLTRAVREGVGEARGRQVMEAQSDEEEG